MDFTNWKDLALCILAVFQIVLLISQVLIVLFSKLKNGSFKITDLVDIVQPLMMKAEILSNLSGDEKKSYVMTHALDYCLKNNLPFNEDAVSQLVERLIIFSKSINVKE